jgi:hypothetical protein
MKQILEIKVRHILDTDPDLSFLGKYRSKKEKWAINRKTQRDWERGQYEYFIPANPPTDKLRINRVEEWKTCIGDYQRMENYNLGHWHMIGIIATAKIQVKDTLQIIHSGGLWGIESDSDQNYKNQIESEELTNLAEQLQELGFKREEILKAEEGYEVVKD